MRHIQHQNFRPVITATATVVVIVVGGVAAFFRIDNVHTAVYCVYRLQLDLLSFTPLFYCKFKRENMSRKRELYTRGLPLNAYENYLVGWLVS